MSDASPTAATPAVRTRTPRWLLALLIISLAANALVAGMVLRSLWHFRAASAMSVDGLPPTFGRFVGQLPAQRQEAIGRNLAEGRQHMLTLRRELRQARQEAAQKFVADPFDKEALAVALARVRDKEGALRETTHSRMPDIAASMSLEERRQFLRWWDRRGGPPRGRGGYGGEGGEDGSQGRGSRRGE